MIQRFFRAFPRIPGSPRLWTVLGLAFLALSGFIAVANQITSPESYRRIHNFDLNVLYLILPLRSPRTNQILTDITALGSWSVIAMLSIAIATLLWSIKDRAGFLHFLVLLLGSALLPETLKDQFARSRPDEIYHLVFVSSTSFPSGHAFGSAAFYTTLAFFAARHVSRPLYENFFMAMALFVVAAICFSRVYLGVHYASDVMAGACAGAAWSFLLAAAFTPIYQREDLKETSASAHEPTRPQDWSSTN